MKKIYILLIALMAMGQGFTSCSEESPYSTATSFDEPRILDPIFPDRVNGNMPVIANINRDANLEITLTVTPADHVSVAWFIDGVEIQTGTTLDINLMAGTYQLKVVVTTTAGKSTSREGIVKVKPLAGDPSSEEADMERIVAPGSKAVLYGNSLDKVKGLVIGGIAIDDVEYNAGEDAGYITYNVPGELAQGEYRVLLVDAHGEQFGGDIVKVYTSSLITGGAWRTNANSEWTLNGINMGDVTSLVIGETIVTDFLSQSASHVTLICPSLEDGDYELKGNTSSGDIVYFLQKGEMADHVTVVVSSQTMVWEGHHYVSWDLADGNPNKTFNLIGMEFFASVKAGATLSISYSVAPEAEYHQLRTTTGHWNDLPGTSAIEFNENGKTDILLTQEILDKISAEEGFLCIGHGYFVDLVTVQ